MDKKNAGCFKKGQPPWNKWKRKEINSDFIKREYVENKQSTRDIANKFNVNQKTIENRLKEIGVKLRNNHTEITKEKIRKTNIRKGIKPKERYSGEPWNKGLTEQDERVKNNIQGLKNARKYQVLPKKDTTIEIKIQNFLKQLNIEFLTHNYINIEHGYQCDILIPSLNTIIECFGTYWHKYPVGRDIDSIRCQELREKGFKVFVFWENEIKLMELNDFTEKILQK